MRTDADPCAGATHRSCSNRLESFTYDTVGHVVQKTDAKGQTTTWQYDARNRVSLTTYDGGSTVTYSYDDEDRVTEIVDSQFGTALRTYDVFGRLATETNPQGTITYSYDAASRRSTMTPDGQPAIAFTYDAADRMISAVQGTMSATIAYDDLNRRSSVTLSNGIVVDYTYDAASQLTAISYRLNQTPLGNLTYLYDPVGNRVESGGTWARTTLPQAVGSGSYDLANQMLTWGGTSFTYDHNGNLVSDGATSYSWDPRNRLTSISGSKAGRFAYRTDGMRTARTTAGVTTTFLYDGLDAIQESTTGSPQINRLLGTRLDETFVAADGSGMRIPLVDAMGSVLAIADSTGAVQAQWTYEPYGRATASGPATLSSTHFTGREDDNTGLYYYRARYYDPATGRFLGVDPLGLRSGLNLYSYAAANPVNASDPTGQSLKTNWKFFWEWVFEDGLDERWYGEGTVELAEFKTSPGASKMRREYKAAGSPQQWKGYFGTIEAYFKTAWMPNTTGFQVGGFTYAAINNNNGTVTYHLKNVAGAYSFFLHVPLIPTRQARETGKVHLFGDITQVFQWIEPLPCCQRR